MIKESSLQKASCYGFIILACVCSIYSSAVYSQSTTLFQVKQRDFVACGVSEGLQGFATANSLGDYSGLDVDFCRAVASAIFNDPTKVDFRPFNSSQRFEALTTGAIDILARNTTWTMSRDSEHGDFAGVNYYDGQGFMVPKISGIRSALELDNKAVCVLKGTTTELNAKDYFGVEKMRYKPIYFVTNDEINEAYLNGDCDAVTTDRSGLAAARATFNRPDAHLVLPEVISKEPLGPMVPKGDGEWADIVRWSLNCMINAEEMGISSSNIKTFGKKANPSARRLLGLEGDFGLALGLGTKWCANIITHIGNYQESYERNVGVETELGLARGVNRLWTNGGLLYAPPIR